MPTRIDVDNFINSLEQQYIPRANAALRRAIILFAEFVLGEAQKLCPVDTGFLASSGTRSDPLGVGAEINVIIGFNADYAVYVHEILDAHHAQGQAKFLETAMRLNAPKLIPFVLQELEKEFGTGVGGGGK